MPIKAQDQTLTLMTYNIYHGEDPYNLGNSNIKEIAELINAIKPDFVALQEVDSMTNRTKGFNPDGKKNLMLELEKLTGMQSFFAKAIDFSDGGYGEGILSRHPAIFESYDLPTPKGGEGRSLAIAKVNLGNRDLIFAGTHLCHEFSENRTAQVIAAHKILKSIGLPIILTGDFNFTNEEKGYDILSEHFIDAALKVGKPKNTYSSKEPKIRIDYFWFDMNSEWEIESVEVLDVMHSDHKPVVVKVRY
ncbi:endonuclease/exonuclease/phosphatase family protein [Aquiflexum sp.]|uniref:endonuclease/exonuclease/phosphatase family protein n=1 Tax=Aquiflexum sp. TaxID=1872584 RepID=UPI00359428A1